MCSLKNTETNSEHLVWIRHEIQKFLSCEIIPFNQSYVLCVLIKKKYNHPSFWRKTYVYDIGINILTNRVTLSKHNKHTATRQCWLPKEFNKKPSKKTLQPTLSWCYVFAVFLKGRVRLFQCYKRIFKHVWLCKMCIY